MMMLWRVRTYRKGKLSRTEFLHRAQPVRDRLEMASRLAEVDERRKHEPQYRPFDHRVEVDSVRVDDIDWKAGFDGES